MFNVSTVGNYISGHSVIHKLNPLIKIISLIGFVVLVFLTDTIVTLGIIFCTILLVFFAAQLPKRQLFKTLETVFIIGVFLFLVNIFIQVDPTYNGNVFFDYSWSVLHFNYNVVRISLLIMFRIYITILCTTLLTATTKPVALTRGIQDLLSPLKLIKVPVEIIAMIISIALRFIPTLLDETQRIMKAQASRGVDFRNGNLKTKSKSLVTLIIPLFVSAFSKAEDLGNAMETRGYDPYEKRTRYRFYPITVKDFFIFTLIFGLFLFVLLVDVYPVVQMPTWWDFL